VYVETGVVPAQHFLHQREDEVSHTYTPYKRPSLIQRFFVRMSTEVDIEGLSRQQILTTRVKCALSE